MSDVNEQGKRADLGDVRARDDAFPRGDFLLWSTTALKKQLAAEEARDKPNPKKVAALRAEIDRRARR